MTTKVNEPVIQNIPNKGLVESAIRDIRSLIQSRGLMPGDPLPSETAISEALNVSRPVVREAFRALSALRVLEIGNGRKARVAQPDAEPLSVVLDHTVQVKQVSIQQILDVRSTLEKRAASLAALRRTDAQARFLEDQIGKMFGALEQPERLMDLDVAFHDAIAKASGNPLCTLLVSSFRVITRQTWEISWRCRGTAENRYENIKCHERIVTAIVERDPDAAEEAMAEHFNSAMTVLLKAGIT